MSFSAIKIQVSPARNVILSDEALTLELADGRTLTVPLTWYPRLWHGKVPERRHWRLIGGGEGIHWPDLDEDISVEALLLGRRSGESQTSLKRWLESRQAAETLPADGDSTDSPSPDH